MGTTFTASEIVSSYALQPTSEPDFPVPTGTIQASWDGVNTGSPVQLTPGPAGGYGYTGLATLTISTTGLASGDHLLGLNYSGDSNYLATNSNGVNVGLVAPDFSVTVNPTNVAVTSGQTTSPIAVQVGTVGGFSTPVSFTCSGLPAEAKCVFSPSTVSGSGNTSLTITTTEAQSVRPVGLAKGQTVNRLWMVGVGGVSASLLVILVVPRRRRRFLLLAIAGCFVITFGVVSCGGGGAGTSTPPPPSTVATTITLSAATATPAVGAGDAFTASVMTAGSGGAATSGTVQYRVDGTASGAAVSLLSNGTAANTLSFSTAGPHSVTASFSGNSALASSSSPIFTVTATPITGSQPGFYAMTITATSGSLSHTASLDLTVN